MKSKKAKVLWIKHRTLTDTAKNQIKTFLSEKAAETGRKMKLTKSKKLNDDDIEQANILMIDEETFIDSIHKLNFQRRMLERCVGIDTELYFYRCLNNTEEKKYNLYSIKKFEVDISIFEVFNEELIKKERA